MSLLAPGCLLLLVPLGLAVAGYVVVQRRRPRFVVRFTAMDLLERVVPETPGWRRHLPPALMLLGLLAMVGGLARPAVTMQAYQDAAVVVAVDVSPRCSPTTWPPPAWRRRGGRSRGSWAPSPPRSDVGLVEFAGTARVRVPPTTEHGQCAGRCRAWRCGRRPRWARRC